VVAAAVGRDFDLTRDEPRVAGALPRLPDARQQHGRQQCRAFTPRKSAAITSARPRSSSRRRIRIRRRASDIHAGPRSINSTRRNSARRRPSPRCAVHREHRISPAVASTAIRAPTPTRSAGRRRPSRCDVRDRERCRPVVRRRRHARGARAAPQEGSQHPRLGDRVGERPERAASAGRPGAAR